MTAMTRLSVCLTALILTCSSLLPLSAVAQKLDFSGKKFEEPVNVEFWKRQIQKRIEGIEIDSTSSSFRKWQPGVIFDRPVDFEEAQFHSGADFSAAQFHSGADFSAAQFLSRAHFDIAHFHSAADFRSAQFYFMANFWKAQFHSKANFDEAQFHSRADFYRTTFDSTAYFQQAQFHSTANFQWTQFHSTTAFWWVQFGSMADFRWAQFLGKVDFWKAKLPDSLDFRSVTEINYQIDFTHCRRPRKGSKCRIALVGTEISKLKLNMNLFDLWFPADTTVDSTFRETVDGIDTIVSAMVDTIIAPSDDEQLSVYEQVLKKLENDGFMESYEILDIEYRRLKARHKGGLSWYVADTFHDWWWNYGYTKERVFLWMLGFWTLFTLLNLLFWYRKLSDEVYGVAFLEKIPYTVSRMKRAAKKVLQVMAYTGIVFFGLKMDVSKFKKGALRQHPWLFTYLMSIYVVGLVCLGFIVNIIFTR